MHGGMRKIYDEKNLRWACDYDCKRIRNVVVSNSNHITLKDFTSSQSGFWNVHILYSHDVFIDNIRIDSANAFSPSTDGIDIDSSYQIEIKNCILSCNDDSISIKAGRDADGLRVNKACHTIFIHDCTILAGFGITIGSEVSGGVHDIKIENIRFKGTDCGFRIKSAMPRKGYIRNIQLNHLEMINVKYLFHFFLNWNPNYSTCKIPQDYKEEIPEYWKALVTPVQNIQNTIVEDIHISNVTAFLEKDYIENSRAFHIEGYEDSPIKNITFQNLKIQCKEFGIINYVENIQFQDFKISCSDKHQSKYDSYDNR